MKWFLLCIIFLVELDSIYTSLYDTGRNFGVKIGGINIKTSQWSTKNRQRPSENYHVKSSGYNRNRYGSYGSHDAVTYECTEPIKPIENAYVKCQSNMCKITCDKDYQFPTGETILHAFCSNNNWQLQDTELLDIPNCEPICSPICENNGICLKPGQCQCPDNYFGPRCEKQKNLCLSRPATPRSSRISCNSRACIVTCMPGFLFPDGTSVTNLNCIDGRWIPSRNDMERVPDCLPTCSPPCENGGSCLSYNVCQCLKTFRGPQCQYSIERCSPKKLKFNGSYNCSGRNDIISCQIKCPKGIQFEYQPAALYTCDYSKGYFEPDTMPQCIYGEGISAIVVDQQSSSGYEKHGYDLKYPTDSWETMIMNVFSKIKRRRPHHLYEGSNSVLPHEPPGIHLIYMSQDVDLLMRTPKGGLCVTWAGNNIKTFDGVIYKTLLHCNYALVKDYVDGTFSVVLKACGNNAKPECPFSLEIFFQNIVYRLLNEDGKITLSTRKKRLPLPVQVMGMRVAPLAHLLRIDLDAIGMVIMWDGKQYISVEANAGLWNRTAGLCGTLDSNPRNDFMSKDGTVLSTPKSFVDSWKIRTDEDSDNCLMDTKEDLVAGRECTSEMEEDAVKLCNKILDNNNLQQCLKEFDRVVLIENCIEEYCNCQDVEDSSSCNCNLIAALVKECQFKGVRLERGWRHTDICPMKCSKERVYNACGPTAEASCGSAIETATTFETCNEGCFCPNGTVQHDGVCISVESCPCRLRNKEFPVGSKTQKDCNTCTCENGKWSCTDITCGGRCGAVGDPHYITFDGRRYNFMGKCSYYLLKTDNITIEAENIACPGSISEAMNFEPSNTVDMPSCTKSVTIRQRINGRDFVIKLHHGRVVNINGKEITQFPVILGQGLLKVRQASSTMISVDFIDGIRVWWDGMTRVYIDAPPSYRGKTQGLCGTFNANIQDDFLTPEGDIESVVEPFADKWRTKDLCDSVFDTTITPHPCQLNMENREKAESYCAQLTSEIFESCHWSVDPAPFYEDCMYDVCACKSDPALCFCPILASYGAECSRQGIITNWRYHAKECTIQCPIGQVYDECGDSCLLTCQDIASKDVCRGHCVEGCRCPPGQYLNEKNECIPEEKCPCVYEGIQFEVGYKEVRPGRNFLELCTCLGGQWECDAAGSRDQELYPPASEMRNQCMKKPYAEFTKCLPNEPKTCKNMHNYVEEFDENCKPGCICMSEYVLDASEHKCVLPQNCSCHHGGKSFMDGDVIKEECSACECKSGKWNCIEEKCSTICHVWGDSHFSTFDKKDFDFQGACDYVLSKGILSGGDGFSITIQNVLCGTMGVTCSKSLKISLFGQLTDFITLSADPSEKNMLPKYKKIKNIGPHGFAIYDVGVFTVVEVSGLGLQIKWDRGTRVYVKLSEQWKGKTSGLCGNNNGDAQDDWMNPSQGLETSALLFGHSWKLQEFCSMPTEQIDSCNEHPERKVWAYKKCGILKSDVFQGCHSEVSIDKFFDRCIFDACACDQGGDCECLCTAIAAYSEECAVKGIAVAWRKPDFCPMQCDTSCSKYDSCISACPLETCDNYLEQDVVQRICHSESCVEGCKIEPCKDGYIYTNDSYTKCVPKKECKPICMKKNGVTYFEGDIIRSDECQTCRCSRKKEICSGAPCMHTTISNILSTEVPMSAQEVQCIEGWTDWSNMDSGPKIGNDQQSTLEALKENDVERIPKLLQLLSSFGFASCPPKYMSKIECRVVDTHETPEQTNDNAYCTLKKGLVCIGQCHDYEIRVYCQCNEGTTIDETIETTTRASTCDPNEPYTEYPEDCFKFQHCEQQPDGSFHYEEKTCGPSMMFNPVSKKCDWKVSVQEVKSLCKDVGSKMSTTPNPVSLGTMLPIKKDCDPNVPHVEHPADCFKFRHCTQLPNIGWSYVEKTCGASMMFNPKTMVCDWPANVLKIKPECGVVEKVTEPSVLQGDGQCLDGQKMSDCAIPCGKACHYYEKTLYEKQICKPYNAECEKGCVEESRPNHCNGTKVWRDKKSCVEISDCPCMSKAGKFVKPNDIFKESECEICQCLDNTYVCSTSSCEQTIEEVTTPVYQEQQLEQLQMSEKPLVIPTIVTPPKKCNPQDLIPVINGDSKLPDSAFSASSILGPSFLPQYAKLHGHPTEIASGSWSPILNDQNQYLQVAFPDPVPLYGVVMQGSPIFDQYVTSFKILYSIDGDAFHYLNEENDSPQIFNGPIDPKTAVESFFKIPVEAKMIRIYPLKWHGGISIRLELLGCGSSKQQLHLGSTEYGDFQFSTERPSPDEPPIIHSEEIVELLCSDPFGVNDGKLLSKQIAASSIKPNFKGETPELLELLKFDSPVGWRPALDSKNQFIMFNFIEPRNITGLLTRGGQHGWVTAFKVLYSNNDYTWNKILTSDGRPKVFLANTDGIETKKNYFKYPIQAQYLKVIPLKWDGCIELKIEPIGCFEDYPTFEEQISSAVTVIPIESMKVCPICPGVDSPQNLPDGSSCLCEPPKFWNGKFCGDRSQCPCIVGHMQYDIGTQYESDDCMQCVCVLGGEPQCKPQQCPPCKEGLRQVKSSNCMCRCEPCPAFQKLCPSSGDCILESLWCNGIQDCEDDELDCEYKHIVTTTAPETIEILNISKTCPDPYCPPGMKLEPKQSRRKMSQIFETSVKTKGGSAKHFGKFKQISKSIRKANFMKTKHQALKKGPRFGKSKVFAQKHEEQDTVEDECFEFVCIPINRPIISQNYSQIVQCPEPSCPSEYEVQTESILGGRPNECPQYTCVPRPQKDAVCLVNGRSFKTFDGTDYKYEICNHILVRDINADKWSIIVHRNCSTGGYICRKEVIIKNNEENYTLTLESDLHVKLNGFSYTAWQLEKSSHKEFEFKVSKLGNTVLFISKSNGFWVSIEKSGDIKIGVSSKIIKTIDGLCGFYNDAMDDDKRMPNGNVAESTTEFGDSWSAGEAICKPQACPKDIQTKAFEMCTAVKDDMFSMCSNAVNVEKFVYKCLESACDCIKSEGNNEQATSKCKCTMLENFVKECLSAVPQLELTPWRPIHNCEISCPAPLVYRDCYKRRCEPCCENLKTDSCPQIPNVCFSGCYCPEGTVRKGENCVPVTECMDCACDSFGKSKYITYDRQNFTIQGNCTYLLSRDIQTGNSHSFQVYVSVEKCESHSQKPVKKTKSKFKNRSTSSYCTAALHVIDGSHIIFVERKSKSKLDVSIDGTVIEKMPFKNGWLQVKEEPAVNMFIALLDSLLEISVRIVDMSFTIQVPSVKYGSKMEGLCGDCNSDMDNDLQLNPNKNHDQTSEVSLKEVVESWQLDDPKLGLNMAVSCATEDLTSNECVPPPPEKDLCMQMLNADIFGQCHLLVDPLFYVSACQQDMCKPGADQKTACEIFSAYAQDCSRNGICLDWRNPEMCPLQCPSGLQYKPCGCAETCETLKASHSFDVIDMNTKSTIKSMKAKTMCSGERAEGCFCPDGKVLNNNECIPQEHCTQCDNGHFAGDTWHLDKCTQCECNNDGNTVCTKQQCPVMEKVCEEEFAPMEISKSEDCCPKFICVPRPTMPTPTTCPQPAIPACGDDQVKKSKIGPDGCIQYICECKPLSECPLLKPHDNLKPGQVIVNSTLGCCPALKIECQESSCPSKLVKCENAFYEIKETKDTDDCCPIYTCEPPVNACIVTLEGNQTMKMLNEKWILPNDPCVKQICSYGENGSMVISEQIEVCDKYCGPGFEYMAVDGKCCGKCVQTMCSENNQLYKPGTVWHSEDNCTTFTCEDRDGMFYIVAAEETCPDLSDCPLEQRFKKGCCTHCKLVAQMQKNCLPESLAEAETIGIIQVYQGKHGLCQNKESIRGFTECHGSCESGSKFNPATYGQEAFCQCCKVESFEPLEVTLKCNDGYHVTKELQVPSSCSCLPCADTLEAKGEYNLSEKSVSKKKGKTNLKHLKG